MQETSRKPRIALMGEFSAGKSTLSNLLLGSRPLPEQVTATRLSPVWMASGTQAPYRVDVDGTKEVISLDDLGNIPVEETRVIRLFFEADILDVCDLIDFPGISDPNMSSEVWQRMLDEVDAVLWCTHATQAWRQSEASVWDGMPQAVRDRSALLITRFDKLTTERDQMRVLARLNKETDGLFAAMFPISLTDALAAGDDYEAFEASGGIAFLEYFVPMIEKLQAEISGTARSLFATHAAVANTAPETAAPEAVAEASASAAAAPAVQAEPAPQAEDAQSPAAEQAEPVAPTRPENAPAVVPRRVRAQRGATRRERPQRRPAPIDMGTESGMDMAQGRSARPNAVSELRSIFQEVPIAEGE